MRDCAKDKIVIDQHGDDQVFIMCLVKLDDGKKEATSLVLDRKKLKKLYRKCMAILDGNTGDNTRVNTVKQEN